MAPDQINYILSVIGTVVGWIILLCVTFYAVPQLIQVLKTKNTSGLSIPGYILFIFSNIGMFLWGVGNAIRTQENPNYNLVLMIGALLPNIITNFLNLTVNIICIVLKITHVKKAKKLHITEDELAAMLLKQQKGNRKKVK